MAALWTSAVGILIVCWTLREVFSDLFQPSGSGTLSSLVGRGVFGLAKRARWMLTSAGPLSIVIVIFCWTALIAIGFSFIFWSRFPSDFVNSSAEQYRPLSRCLPVFYFSLAALTTLGSTEFTPHGSWIRIVAAIESLIGISLVSASVTWILLIYPALGRTRTLARRVSTLYRAQEKAGVDFLSDNVETILAELAQGVLRARVDLIHFPLIYYFHAGTEGASLGRFLIQLYDLASRASANDRPEPIRLGAALLSTSLDDVAELLKERFVDTPKDSGARSVFEAVAKDHLEGL